MNSLLRIVKTPDDGSPEKVPQPEEQGLQEVSRPAVRPIIEAVDTEEKSNDVPQTHVDSAETCSRLLKSQPKADDIIAILRFLDFQREKRDKGDFKILASGPLAAQILHLLVSVGIQDHWGFFQSKSSLQTDGFKPYAAFLRCLTSTAGITALVVRVRSLLAREGKYSVIVHGNKSAEIQVLKDTLSTLSAILKPTNLLLHLHRDINILEKSPIRRQLVWKETMSLFAGGKVLSTVAEACTVIGALEVPKSVAWVADGRQYASWLGRNISLMMARFSREDDDAWKSLGELMGRSLGIGHSELLVEHMNLNLLLCQKPSVDNVSLLLDKLKSHDQGLYLKMTLRSLEKKYLPDHPQKGQISRNNITVDAAAALIKAIIQHRSGMKSSLHEWLVNGLESEIKGIDLRRSAIAAVSADDVLDLFFKSLEAFGDPLSIKHTALKKQDANLQVLLLLSGRLYRTSSFELRNALMFGSYLTTVSNRMSASSPDARLFGMYLGVIISKLIDDPSNTLTFEFDDAEKEELEWYRGLTQVEDCVGSLQDLVAADDPSSPFKSANKRPLSDKPAATKRIQNGDKAVPRMTAADRQPNNEKDAEDESYSDSDSDFVSYEKPDSDTEDSEEDPTLIDRSKPRAPIYIRELLAYLRDQENPTTYHLGITTAATLIRRKASFGTEVAEYIDALALATVGLQDKYNLPRFEEYRLQAEVALIVSLPLTMGRWFVHALFNADLNQEQRSTVLVALGLSARELAGFGAEDAESLKLPAITQDMFPSKRLPENMEAFYSDGDRAISEISKRVANVTLQPLALEAADSVSGPNALKVRTFSSRMEVEGKRRQQQEERRKRMSPQDIHKILPDGFFFPLSRSFGLVTYTIWSSKAFNPFLTPHILRLFLHTLSIILSTLGPNTPRLAAITHDTVTILMGLHNNPVVREPHTLPAFLSLFLTLLEITISCGSTAEERLVTDYATEITELRSWTDGVFNDMPSDDKDTKVMAAGCCVKLGEILERFQGRLLGINSGFAY